MYSNIYRNQSPLEFRVLRLRPLSNIVGVSCLLFWCIISYKLSIIRDSIISIKVFGESMTNRLCMCVVFGV